MVRNSKNLKKSFLKIKNYLTILAAFFYCSTCYAQVTCNQNPQTTPQGLKNFFIMNSDGVFDPMTTLYQLPSGSSFDTGVLSRTPAEIVQRRTDAYNYFLATFGIDFFSGTPNADGTVLSADGNVLLFHTAVDPRWSQKIIYSGGDNISRDGWIVHEARYAASVISSSFTATGTWGGAGVPLPFGATMADGEWVFDRVVPCTNDADGSAAPEETSTIHIRYQTQNPFIPDFQNRAAIEYDLFTVSGISSTTGRAVGRIELNQLPGDLIQAIVKISLRLN